MKNGYELIYKKNDPICFWNAFKSLILEYKVIGSRFDQLIIDYYLVRAIDENYQINDLSCIYSFDGVPFFAFLGTLFSKNNRKTLSLFEIPCFGIDSINITQSQKKKVSQFLENLLSIDFDVFTLQGPDYNSRLSFICEFLISLPGSKINCGMTRTIDLSKNEIHLKKTIRKSYHSLINWGLRELNIEIHDTKNISWDIMDKFRKLHIEESKRETRSIRTWEKQFEAIKKGSSFCITAHTSQGLISAAYFILANNACYYGSSVSKRSLFDKPINHAILWKGILESKRKGALLFDIGSTYLDESKFKFSKKEKNIAYFKEGFGGKQNVNYIIEFEK